MSKPKKHPKKPGEDNVATGQGKRGQKGKGICLEDRPILEATRQELISVRGKSLYSQTSPKIWQKMAQ